MPLKIYLVEDSPVIRENLIESLQEMANAEVVGTSDTEDGACAWLDGHKQDWEMAVVDLFLLKGTGMGVVINCKGRDESQKVVVLTNYATEHIKEKCLALGANAVFDKSQELDLFFDYAMAHRDENRASARRLRP